VFSIENLLQRSAQKKRRIEYVLIGCAFLAAQGSVGLRVFPGVRCGRNSLRAGPQTGTLPTARLGGGARSKTRSTVVFFQYGISPSRAGFVYNDFRYRNAHRCLSKPTAREDRRISSPISCG
jgi:hypothetical protein